MKRNLLTTLIALATGSILVLNIAACNLFGANNNNHSNQDDYELHEHTYTTAWSIDATHHWRAATCEHTEEVTDYAEHSIEDGICTVCCCVFNGTAGIEYTISEERTYYTVSDIGTATDEDIVIPSVYNGLPIKSIGYNAFNGYQLDSVTISNGIIDIGDYAFNNCDSLTSVAIPNSVIDIGMYAFRGCLSLNSIIIPCGIKNIGAGAFEHCSALSSITIPNSVSNIGSAVFYGCISLEKIIVEDGNSVYHSSDNCLIETKTKTLVAGCKNSVIPSDGSVEYIGGEAFGGCKSLNNIIIPSSITAIGDFAFSDCTSLTSIIIPSSVTNITNINNAFSGCSSLKNIVVEEGNPVYHSTNDCVIETETKTLVIGCNSSIIPTDSSVTTIGSEAFRSRTALKSIVIPDNITSIGHAAFYNCTSLTDITLPNNIISIDTLAFSDCTSLANITMPTNIKTIGWHAFSGCKALTKIFIPSSVTNIEDYAFTNCTSLEEITVESGNSVYHSSGNCLIETETKTLIVGCRNSIIPDDGSVTTIGDSAFLNLTKLTNIIIPNTITIIGNSAFAACYSLTNLIIPSSVTSIGNRAFRSCWSLENITIPNSIKNIGSSAFSGCLSLKTIYYTGNEEQWNNIEIGTDNNKLVNAEIIFS